MTAEPDIPDDIVVVVERELVTLTRQIRNGARAIYLDHGLTFVEYSLLTLVEEHPGISAGVVAGEAKIDKSTASRQLARLRERGLLDRAARSLQLTNEATQTLAAIRIASGLRLQARVRDWPQQDIATFAELLRRFNEVVLPPP